LCDDRGGRAACRSVDDTARSSICELPSHVARGAPSVLLFPEGSHHQCHSGQSGAVTTWLKRWSRSEARVIAVLIVVFVAGVGELVALVAGSDSADDARQLGYVEPRAEPRFDLVVTALSEPLTYDAEDYHVPAGVVKITLAGATGHTLVILG